MPMLKSPSEHSSGTARSVNAPVPLIVPPLAMTSAKLEPTFV